MARVPSPPTQTQQLATDIDEIFAANDELLTVEYLTHRFRRPETTVRDAMKILTKKRRWEVAGVILRASVRPEVAYRRTGG